MGLFGFGKKKDVEVSKAVEPALSAEETQAQVAELKATLEDKEGAERADVLNQIGKLFADAGLVDEALAAYEESLEVNHVMGKASNALVRLYNKKRTQAAQAGDNDGAKAYMDKVNEMLALSKDQLRGRA